MNFFATWDVRSLTQQRAGPRSIKNSYRAINSKFMDPEINSG